tara:strand:- start:11204 stop:11761 length:558 start_codon:yes stop_codon:yes gene_type:complete
MKYGYARVSTEDQQLSLQIDALNKEGVDEIITEKISGTSKEFKERTKLLESLQKNDEVIFWKLDRLGRSIIDVLHFLKKVESKGATIKCLTENIETKSPAGRMFAGMILLFSEYDNEIRKERTRAGLESAKKRGVSLGRRKKLTKQQEEFIISSYNEGKTQKYIANILKVDRTTIRRYEKALNIK